VVIRGALEIPDEIMTVPDAVVIEMSRRSNRAT